MKPLKLFYSYSHTDETLRKKLETHLSILKREGVVSDWHDRDIEAGASWAAEIDKNLDEADLILLLVSADFLASEYCYSTELKRALERHEEGSVTVIPVILRPVDWQGAPFGKLQALPKDAKAVTTWSNRDAAFTNVVRGIRLACEKLQPLISKRPEPLDAKQNSKKRESFIETADWHRLLKKGDWTLDEGKGQLSGSGVHSYLISSKTYGERSFDIRTKLSFTDFEQHLERGSEQMNAGIVLGWRFRGPNPSYYNLLITGEQILLECIGSHGGDAFRDYTHLSRGVACPRTLIHLL